jgi:hypothetical protein
VLASVVLGRVGHRDNGLVVEAQMKKGYAEYSGT